jgi:putative addiction module component (TIGR02574 family)
MSEAAQAVLDQAMKLSVEERERLVGQLMSSIDDAPLTEAEAEALDAEWAPEIRRRIAELESGRAKLVPWAEVRAELQALIGE